MDSEKATADEMNKKRAFDQSRAVGGLATSPISNIQLGDYSEIGNIPQAGGYSPIDDIQASPMENISGEFQQGKFPTLEEQEAAYQRQLKLTRIKEKTQAGNFQGALGEVAGEKEIENLKNINFKNPKEAMRSLKSAKAALKNLKASDIASEAAEMGGQIVTAKILNAAEVALVAPTVISNILGFIYINIHAFCRYSHVNMELREYFCPFGAEWTGGGKAGIGKIAGGAGGTAAKGVASGAGQATAKTAEKTASQAASTAEGAAEKAAAAAGEAGAEEASGSLADKGMEMASGCLEMVEIAALIILDLLVIAVLALVVGILVYIGYLVYQFYTGNPWEKVKLLFGPLKPFWQALGGII